MKASDNLKCGLTLNTSLGISGESLGAEVLAGMSRVAVGSTCTPSSLLLSLSMHCSLHSSCRMFVRHVGVLCLKLGGLRGISSFAKVTHWVGPYKG